MGTYYRRPNQFFSNASTRLITIPTSPVTQVVLTSGYTFMSVTNIGPSTIAYGGSNLTVSSGGLLFYSMEKEFKDIQDQGFVHFIADSVAGRISVNEFRQ